MAERTESVSRTGGFAPMRADMVRRQLGNRGINDQRVLAAMGRVPRERFVPPGRQSDAYDDAALGIGLGQTISQPFMVAVMSQLLGLSGGERVLEIGTGSGYQTAVLAELVRRGDASCGGGAPAAPGRVYTIERIAELSRPAQQVLAELGYDNISFRIGDGSLGWPEQAPFDAVLLTAAAPVVPGPLIDQLARGGRFVGPVGPDPVQTLVLWVKNRDGSLSKRDLIQCRFVPLIGSGGGAESLDDSEFVGR